MSRRLWRRRSLGVSPTLQELVECHATGALLVNSFQYLLAQRPAGFNNSMNNAPIWDLVEVGNPAGAGVHSSLFEHVDVVLHQKTPVHKLVRALPNL